MLVKKRQKKELYAYIHLVLSNCNISINGLASCLLQYFTLLKRERNFLKLELEL